MQVADLGAHFFHLVEVMLIFGLTHLLQDGHGLLGTEGCKHIQALWEIARHGFVAHPAVNQLVKDVGIQRETLSHEAKPLGGFRTVFPNPNPHRVYLWGRQLAGRLQKFF